MRKLTKTNMFGITYSVYEIRGDKDRNTILEIMENLNGPYFLDRVKWSKYRSIPKEEAVDLVKNCQCVDVCLYSDKIIVMPLSISDLD